ncbi:MAG: hypothetical protein P8100_03180 [bacterium]
MDWLIFWIAIYLVIIVVLALYHLRSTDLDQYLVNNRNTRTLPLVFTMLATLVGGGTSIGLMALGYESGFASVGIGVGYVIGFMIMIRFAGKIRTYGEKHNIYSFPHFLNHKYTSRDEAGFTRIFSAAVSGVNINNNTATIISAVIIIVYTAIAGLSGVIITDTIQFIAIVIMIIFIFIPGILEDTAWFSRMHELPPDFLNGTQLGYAFLIALFIFLPWSVLVRMDVWQRILAAKSEKVARRVSFWSGMGMLPFYIVFPLVGMSVKLFLDQDLGPDETAGVVYLFIKPHTAEILLSGMNIGPILFGFAIVGLMSALMSSGDSFLNIISISTVKDTIFAPITLFALISKHAFAYRRVALASILSAFVVNITLFTWGVIRPDQFQAKSSFIPAFVIAVLVLLIGVRLTRGENKVIQEASAE